MARRKNVKRIDPRYFLNETVNRNDDGSRLEEDLEEGIFSYDDSGRLRAKELDAADLDASGEERLAFEKDPRAHSRDPRTIDRSNVATNPPGKQDIYQFLKQDHPEIWAAWTQKQEIEEGFKDFVQGAKDTFKDITKGRKLGKTRQIRKDKEAALDYEAGRADREKEYERDRRAREAEDARSGDAISNVFGGSKAKARIARQDAEERSEKRKRAEIERRRQKVKDDIQADKWKNRSRLRNQEVGEID